MENRINAGYKIVTALRVSKTEELVIGHNAEYPDMWVCWYCNNGNNYSTGFYCGTFKQALDELADRIKRNLCYSDFGVL